MDEWANEQNQKKKQQNIVICHKQPWTKWKQTKKNMADVIKSNLTHIANQMEFKQITSTNPLSQKTHRVE